MKLFKKETPYGVSLLLSGLVMLGFVAVVFLGLSGMFLGNLIVPIAIVCISVLPIVYCLLKMCKSKLTNSVRRGWIRELLLGLIILLIMLCGAMPISNVVGAMSNQGKFQQSVDSVIKDVESIPLAYRDYVDARVECYRTHLLSLSEWESEYNDMLARAGGSSQSAKAIYVCNSLMRRLITADMDSIENVRKEWLLSLTDIDAFGQRSISIIASSGIKWMDEYKELSSIQYLGEDAKPFDDPALRKKLSKIGGYSQAPNMYGFVICIVCFVAVLIPYFMIRRSRKGKVGTHG